MPKGIYNRTKPAWNKGLSGYKLSMKVSKKGKHHSPKTEFKKGQAPWNKGKKCPEISERQQGEKNHQFGKHISEEHKRRISEAVRDEKHPSWKGDAVGYRAIHDWVDKKLGKPKKCEHCGRTDQKKYEWANTDHQYRRNLTDWKRLCTSCHRNYDKSFNSILCSVQ